MSTLRNLVRQFLQGKNYAKPFATRLNHTTKSCLYAISKKVALLSTDISQRLLAEGLSHKNEAKATLENQLRKKNKNLIESKNRHKNAVKNIENIPIRDYGGSRALPRRT